jgi:hypothetical protein
MDGNLLVFYTSLYTFIGSCLLAMFGMLYKCKSKKFKICCIEVERDVQIELKEDLATLNRSQSIDNQIRV